MELNNLLVILPEAIKHLHSTVYDKVCCLTISYSVETVQMLFHHQPYLSLFK